MGANVVNTPSRQRRYLTLDGLRGVAALMVMTRHALHAFDPVNFGSSFLAVDLFYVMSGFVLAEAYGKKIASGRLTVFRFMLARYSRLWPLYVIATFVGLVMIAVKASAGKTGYPLSTVIEFAPFALVMLPSPLTPQLAPWNAVAWSLFFELFINLLWVMFFPRLTPRVLFAVMLITTGALAIAAFQPKGLDSGFTWATIWVGVARVSYSFSVGLLLARFKLKLPRVTFPAWAILAAAMFSLSIPAAPLYQLIAVLIIFPVIIAMAITTEPSRGYVIYLNLGLISYPLYLFHPLFFAYASPVLRKVGLSIETTAPWSGLLIASVLIAFSISVERVVDLPIKIWRHRKSTAAAAVT